MKLIRNHKLFESEFVAMENGHDVLRISFLIGEKSMNGYSVRNVFNVIYKLFDGCGMTTTHLSINRVDIHGNLFLFDESGNYTGTEEKELLVSSREEISKFSRMRMLIKSINVTVEYDCYCFEIGATIDTMRFLYSVYRKFNGPSVIITSTAVNLTLDIEWMMLNPLDRTYDENYIYKSNVSSIWEYMTDLTSANPRPDMKFIDMWNNYFHKSNIGHYAKYLLNKYNCLKKEIHISLHIDDEGYHIITIYVEKNTSCYDYDIIKIIRILNNYVYNNSYKCGNLLYEIIIDGTLIATREHIYLDGCCNSINVMNIENRTSLSDEDYLNMWLE